MKIVLLVTFTIIGLIGPGHIYAQENSSSIELERDDSYYLGVPDSIENDLDLEGDSTLEAWVKVESFNQRDLFIINKADPNVDDSAYFLFVNGQGKIEGRYSSNGTLDVGYNLRYLSQSLFPLNEWVHVAVTIDISEQKVKLYVNGEDTPIDVFGSMGPTIHNSDQDFIIGARRNNSLHSHFNGNLDEIRVWNKVRTQAEIEEDMERELSGDEPGLVGYWQFDGNFEDESIQQNKLTNDGNVFFSEDVPFEGIKKEESIYPLYTQIVSPYPSVNETNGWAEKSMPCGKIKACGCALTSLVMAARASGVTEDVDGNDVNPGNLNAWLKANEGYATGGYLKWSKAFDYFGKKVGEVIETPFSLKRHNTSTSSVIQAAVAAENEHVIGFSDRVAGGHYFVVSDYIGGTYHIRDPWYYDTKTLNDVDNGETYVFDYDNDLDKANVVAFSEPAVLAGFLEIVLASPAELRLKNESAQTTGYDAGEIRLEIPTGSYDQTEFIGDPEVGVPEGGPHYVKRLMVLEADGQYVLEVIGTGSGEYTLAVSLRDSAGGVHDVEFVAPTSLGVVDRYLIDVETGDTMLLPYDGTELIAAVDQTITDQILNRFFKQWAEKIKEEIEEDKQQQAIQHIDTFRVLLKAKDVESEVLNIILQKLETGLVG